MTLEEVHINEDSDRDDDNDNKYGCIDIDQCGHLDHGDIVAIA